MGYPMRLDKRAMLVWMWMNGLSACAIAKCMDTSISTVYRWIRRWRHEGNVENRPRRGRIHRSSCRLQDAPPLVPAPPLLQDTDARGVTPSKTSILLNVEPPTLGNSHHKYHHDAPQATSLNVAGSVQAVRGRGESGNTWNNNMLNCDSYWFQPEWLG